MSTKVNREQFLSSLEAVSPGLSPRDIIEQSSCFIFKNGYVQTYNDEVACCGASGLNGEVTGAAQADKLLEVLRKLPDEEVGIAASEEHLIVTGKGGREAGIRMEKEILLAVDSIDKPDSWLKLHEDFAEAIGIVQQCASADQSKFEITCVHIHPKWVEATDSFQICRWRLKTGIKEPALVKQNALRHIVPLGMTEFSETSAWIHFRNGQGLTLSCRRYVEDFPDLGQWLKVEGGTVVALPKGLVEAADKAEIFSSENTEDNYVTVELRPGKLKLRGQGVSGWYTETKKVAWTGDAMSFMISPKLLVDLVKRHNECLVSPDRLKVDGGKYQYVTCLFKPEEKESEEEAT